MYYPCSENKGADQLRSFCEADLHLFLAYADVGFPMRRLICSCKTWSLRNLRRMSVNFADISQAINIRNWCLSLNHLSYNRYFEMFLGAGSQVAGYYGYVTNIRVGNMLPS